MRKMNDLLKEVKNDVNEQKRKDILEEKEREKKVNNIEYVLSENESTNEHKIDNPSIYNFKKNETNLEILKEIKEIYKKYYLENKESIEKNIKNYDDNSTKELLRYRDDMLKYSFPLTIVQELIMEEINNED